MANMGRKGRVLQLVDARGPWPGDHLSTVDILPIDRERCQILNPGTQAGVEHGRAHLHGGQAHSAHRYRADRSLLELGRRAKTRTAATAPDRGL